MSSVTKDYFSLLQNADETRNAINKWIPQTFALGSLLSFPFDERGKSTREIMCHYWRYLQ
uniref:Uncharacterized protein n=1 Tax=Lepeophtheirus salmonis TaxID=72036 RepID=A0A0K2UYK8_LEPSM